MLKRCLEITFVALLGLAFLFSCIFLFSQMIASPS